MTYLFLPLVLVLLFFIFVLRIYVSFISLAILLCRIIGVYKCDAISEMVEYCSI